MEQVTNRQAFAAQIGEVLFGSHGSVVFPLRDSCRPRKPGPDHHVGPRVYFEWPRDGLFFRAAASSAFQTAGTLHALQAVLASLLVFKRNV